MCARRSSPSLTQFFMGRKKCRKSALIVHKIAGPSLRRSKSPPIAQRKHVGFSIKEHGVQVTTSYMSSSAKPVTRPAPVEPVPTNWIDAENMLWENAMPLDWEEPRKRVEEDINMSIPQQEAYLEELINHEGRGYNPPNECPDCSSEQAIYQCQNCFSRDLLCQDCILKRHAVLPFHQIRVSNL